MKRFSALVLVAVLQMLITPVVQAASNLNSSKSNIYRLTYTADLTTVDQAKALLEDLDKLGPPNQSRLKRWLPANFKRFGISPERVKKMVILPAGKAGNLTAILLLTNPADEAEAIAVTVKSSKSNSSE
ncbi:MAG: hypothetical protein ABR576_01160 [Thermoanaerobaculia bacterium]